jgi:DNA-binding SARP family transcriptional activator
VALEFAILGPLEIRRNGRPVEVTSPQRRALLSLLLLRANEPVPQDELIDELWDGQAPSTARASLQNQIHALRKALGPQVLERRPAGYVLHVEGDRLDVQRFRRLSAEARRGGAGERAAKLRDALECWRGPALVDTRAEAFAQTEIARLEEERLTALEDRIDADFELGEHSDLVAELEQLVSSHPLRERLWAQLMIALYRSGRQADALATYRRAHQRFTADLGIEPGAVLRELQRKILIQDLALDDPAQRLGSTLERAAAMLPRERREQAESLYEYGSALMRIGERRQATATLEAAIRAAAAAAEPGLEQRAKLTLSFLSIFTEGRRTDQHLAATVEAIHQFERLDDEAGLALACWHRATLLWGEGRADEGAEWARRGLDLSIRVADTSRASSCRAILARCIEEGTTPVEPAIQECEKQLQADSWGDEEPFALGALALLHAHANRIDEARSLARRALEQVRQAGLGWNVASALSMAGGVERIIWNLDEAAAQFRTAYELLEAEDDRSFLADCGGWLACVHALRGDVESARGPAQVARRLAKPTDPSADTIWRRALALVAAHDGRAEEARQLSSEALERVRETDVLAAQGDTHEEAAFICELLGDAAGAREALAEALALFERKGSVAGATRVRERLASIR